MKIRVKVKHLVLGMLSVAMVISALFYIPKMRLHMTQEQLKQGSVIGKEQLLREMDHASSNKQKWDLIRSYIIEDGSESIVHGFQVFVGSGFTQSSSNSDGKERPSFSWEEKVPHLEAYLGEGPNDDYLVRAAKQLAIYYGSEGRQAQAIQILESAEHRLDSRYTGGKRQLMLERAKLLANQNLFDQAERVLDELIKNNSNSTDLDLPGNVAKIRAQMFMRQGSVSRALEEVSRELIAFKTAWDTMKGGTSDAGGATPMQIEQLTLLQEQLQRNMNQQQSMVSTVSGTVQRKDGVPVARVGVYLRNRAAVNHSVVENEPYQTLTDADGHFEFAGVIPDSYMLFIGLKFDQIDGWTWPVKNDEWIDIKGGNSKTVNVVLHPLMNIVSPVNDVVVTGKTVQFEWEPVEGASWYTLNANVQIENGTMGSIVETHLSDTQLELPVNALYDWQTGISYNTVGDKQIADGSSLLGFANTENRFSWSVEAFDADGKMLSRSNGYRLNTETMGNLPFFYLKERSLTAADRLLLGDQLDQAMTAYKRAFQENNKDLHSLRMILRLYQAEAADQHKSREEDGALPYMLRMVQLNPTENDVFQLFYFYFQKRDWSAVEDYYAKYMNLHKGAIDAYVQSLYATALMNQGKFSKAREQFLPAITEDDSHRFVGNYLAAELYVTGSFETARSLAEKYPDRSSSGAERDWLQLIRKMVKEEGGKAGYWKELRQTIEWHFYGEKVQLDEWKSRTGNTALKAFIEALEKVS